MFGESRGMDRENISSKVDFWAAVSNWCNASSDGRCEDRLKMTIRIRKGKKNRRKS